MTLRSPTERVLQTLAYEAGGILVATPLFSLTFGQGTAGSATLLIAISAAVLLWSPLFNTAFDAVEWHLTRRRASDRPARLRLLHAVMLEVSVLALTVPLVMTLTGEPLAAALTVNLALTVFYAAYAYLFHLAYDRLRPVNAGNA